MSDRRTWAAFLPLFALACSEPAAAPADAGAFDSGPMSATDAGFAFTAPPSEWCRRVAAGPAGSSTVAFALALSRVHASVRYFGPDPTGEDVDLALAGWLDAPGEPDLGRLERYASGLAGACALDASDRPLGAAEVRISGTRAVVRPGTGPVDVPSSAAEVVLDLTELSDHPELEAALRTAASAVIARDLTLPAERVRRFYGHPDEVYSILAGIQNIYTSELIERDRERIASSAGVERSLVVLTSAVMPPSAARLAGALRLGAHGRIVGHDVLASVAESRWSGLGARGVAWRDRELVLEGGGRWPDLIAADVHADDPRAAADLGFERDAIEPVPAGPDARARFEARAAMAATTATAPVGLGLVRAALVAAHGTIRRFWPYFAEIGDGIDGRLVEQFASLGANEARSRRDAVLALRRLANALEDAHSFVHDWAPDTSQRPLGYFPAWLERTGDVLLVRESRYPDLAVGDAIVAIGGQRIADYYAEKAAQISAATAGNRDAQISGDLLTLFEPLTVDVVRYGETTPRTVQVQPMPASAVQQLTFQRSTRRSGWLGDLGAPAVYLIQMEGSLNTPDELLASARTARTATAVIVDMRGYPWDFDHPYTDAEIATALQAHNIIQGGRARSPQFYTPIWNGADGYELEFAQYANSPVPEELTIPLVLLVGPETQSSAENFSIMFLDGHPDAIVVGRASSGTNGNITGVNLGGGFGFAFTGLRVLFPDGRRFHGVGIVPTVPLVTTAQELHDGVDRDLLEALRALGR